MDIVNSCKHAINEMLQKLDSLPDENGDLQDPEGCSLQTQCLMDASPEHDKNLNRLLEQQNHLKMIIDRDEQIKMLRRSINENISAIDRLRKMCSKIAQDALRDRESNLKTHADNVSVLSDPVCGDLVRPDQLTSDLHHNRRSKSSRWPSSSP